MPVPAVTYQLLGPVTALVDGRPADLGGPRQRGVLVVLLSDAGRLVPATHIVDAIWGDEPPASAANLVQRSISQLRKALGKDAIETRGAGYMARIEPDALDLHVFERLAACRQRRPARRPPRGGRGRAAPGARPLARSRARGPRRPGLPGAGGRASRRAAPAGAERALEADLGLGRHADATAEIEALVHTHPLRERPRELLMRALYGAGRQAEALDAYREARCHLRGRARHRTGARAAGARTGVLRQDPSLRSVRELGRPAGRDRAAAGPHGRPAGRRGRAAAGPARGHAGPAPATGDRAGSDGRRSARADGGAASAFTRFARRSAPTDSTPARRPSPRSLPAPTWRGSPPSRTSICCCWTRRSACSRTGRC